MANATMQALQTHAEKLNQQVTEVNASIKALGDVPDDNPALLEYRKQLRRLNSDLKDVNTTMKDYTRGVKAAGELYRHYAMGNIEDMSIKAIRAGVNGMKKRYDNLKAGGDPGDAEEMRLIEAITTEADVVVKRFKTDYQHVVEEITRGGTVTEQTLKRTRDGLADLMQTAETEAEKNELTNYWQKVGAAIEAVAVENRRLRGEVADREEAMRIAYATDHEGSQQAIHDAEARADAARRENDELRQRLDLKQQQRRELEQEMDINSMQQRALMDQRDELKAQEKENRAIRNQRVDDADKEVNAARRAAKTQQQAYDEQKQTVEKLRTEVQGLTDDIRKMGEVKAEPKIDTSGIDELKAKIESLKQQKQGTSDYILDLEKEIEGLHEFDRIIDEGKKNIHIYWETIKEFEQKAASVKGKPAYMMGDIFDSSKADTDAMRNQVRTWIGELGKELKDNPQAKSITKLRDAYLQRVEDMIQMRDAANKRMAGGGLAADVEAELKQRVAAINRIIKEYREAFEKFEHSRAHYQDRMEGMGYEDSLRIKGEQLENNKKHLAQIDGELIDAQTKLAAAQQQSTTATTAQGDALKDLDKLQDEYNQKVERRKQLEQELQAIQTASYNDDPKIRQLKAEIEKIEELIAVSDKYRKQFTKMSDEKFDEGFKGKDESRRSIWEAQKYLDDAYNDKLLKAPLANMDLPDADKYKDAAKRVAEGIVQNAQENVRRVIFEQIKDGRWTPEVMEENLQSMRNMMNNAGNSELGLKDNPEYQAYKYIVAQMERYLEVAKQVQAEREKIAGSEPFLKATQQDDYEHGIYPEGLSRQVEKREFQDLTGWRSWKAENDDREGRKSVELKKAQDEESESLGRLNKAKKESAEQTAAQAQSSEQLAQKQEQLSQKTAELNQQQDKLNGMVDETVTANQRLAKAEQEQTDARNAQAEAEKHEGEAVKKVEDELRGLTDEQLKNAQACSHLTEEINTDTAAMQRNITTEQEATREADRLRSGSIDKMEQALARLRESNRKLDPTIDKEEWERGERAIGQLNLRLEELKKQSAELRREPVLDMMTQRMQSLGTLSRDALSETKKFWQAMYDGAENDADKLREIEDNLKRINTEEQKRDRKTLEERAARLQQVDNYSVGELREGIDAAKRLQDQYHLTEDELQQLSVNIVAAETRIAKVGVEAERQAQKQREQIELMQQQLANGSALTESALKAQVNYWQRLADDPKAAAEAVKQYTANMERAQSLLDVKDRVDIRIKAGRLDNMDGYSVSELREGIDAAKKMQDTFRLSNDEVQQLSEKIVSAEVRISQFSVESERQAQRQREQIALMEQQLANGSALTESALKAQVNYWQRLADDPKAAAEAVAQYTANMKQAQDLLDQSQRTDIESKAGRLQNLGAYSVSEIREGIDAAKKMQDTFHLTDAEVQQLSEDIVAAEKHVSQFSVENERAAQKQREQVATMEQQLQGMTNQMAQHNSVSVNALKAQHSYWQKLIDDPKTATENLQQYQDNLAETERLQRRMVGKQGQEALDWFRGGMDADASANDIKERAAAMKEWRDTLPKESQADVIAEIDGYLKAAGVSAKKAAEDVMDLKEALDLAEKAGNSKQPFNYSAQEIQAATKALELRREELIKQIRAERDLGNAVDAQEKELDDLTKKLRSLKFEQDNVNMSQEKMRTLIETPANAVNLDELRAAIKRADGQLRQMQQSLGENSSEYKRFAEQVRQAKNVMKEMEGQAKASATAWEKAFSRLKTYVVMYMGFNEVWQKVSNTARDLMDLSDRMGEVRKTTGFTADEVGRLSENLKGLDSRRSLTELMELSSMAGSIGLKTVQDVQGFTEAANQLTVALPEMGAEASRTLMKIADATGDLEKNGGNVRETLERVGSTIIALRANSAAAAGPITDFVSRVGAVGAQAGISIDQIAALGATVDALGGRVEMSATALSRMIPAIRNNSFEVAKAIGMTEKELKDMTAMDQMVAIFRALRESVQGFDTSTEEGMNAMADKVEQMLGNSASMQEVMKTLNQQGARAGIVFGLLSQNVDMLEKQLGIADDAYRENIALMNEYLNMNEATAAKWERLKNQIEELFVSDTMQRGLGVLIDMLRGLVDFLTGNVSGAMKGLSVTVHTLAFAFLAFKSNIGGLLTSLSRTGKVLGDMKAYMQLAIGEMKEYRKQTLLLAAAHTAEEKAAIKAKLATLGAAKAMRANLFMAAAAAIAAIALQLYNVWKEARKVQDIASEAMANYSREMEQATKKADKMFESVGNARVAVKDANAEVKRAEDGLKAAKKALDEGRGSTESLEKAETDLKVAHQKVTAANNDHASSIRQLNQEYSPYLGYMLSEISTAAELANARELINAKLRETILLKQQEAAYGRVESEFGEKRDKRQKSVYDLVAENVTDPEVAARMRKDIMELVKQAKDGSKTIIDVRNEWAKISRNSGVEFSVTDFQAMESNIWRLVETEREIQDAKKIIDDNIAADIKVARTGTRDKKGNTVTKGTQQELQDQLDAIYKGDEGKGNGLQDLQKRYASADAQTRKQRAADLLHQMDAYEKLLANSKNFYDLKEKDEETSYKTLLTNSDKRMQGLRTQRDELLKAAGDAYKPIQETDNKRGNGGGGDGGTNPYGQYDRVTDPYSKWNGDDLVARRKEMLVRVRALANGADVQKVLSEDAKFISEAVRKNIKTTEQAIEWYNAERLKIQEALYNKHLTPTGDWLDPKKGAGNWRKQLQTDFDNYLRILDAYYTERKAHIEKAQAEEGLSEAEAQRLTVENETVWRKHRMELQQIYLGKSADIAEDERQRIYNILAEQDEDSADMVEKQIAISINKLHLLAQKSEVEARKIETKLVKDIATDHYKQQNAVSKQMEAIEKIISEERPFDGITKNLRDNLSTMGVLFADFDKKRREAIERGEQPEDDMAERAKQMAKRLSVVLDGVPDAYRMTFDQLKEVMIKEGFGEWAKAIEGDEQLKLAMMAQIRKIYDQVQEAIRKEAALIKKHADNLWNDALTPDGKSMKNQFEAAISQLGLQADQVKRANSLIGAGVASDRVADRLVIQQMKVQLAMERARFALMHKIGEERIRQEQAVEESLRRQKRFEEAKRKHADIENMQKSLGLAISEEQKKVDEQRVAIQNQLEESQNRLYTELREWADLLTSSLQGVFEASHAGDAEYYNERAKLDLTGKGGPGAGTYVVIDDAGTSDATAHYEYLDERQALERQHEIEIQNAQAEAWRKLMDDINMKMSEQITDWLNAAAQNASVDANTDATLANTEAIVGLTAAMGGKVDTSLASGLGYEPSGNEPNQTIERIGYEAEQQVTQTATTESAPSVFLDPNNVGLPWEQQAEAAELSAERQVGAIDKVKVALDDQFHKQEKGSKESSQKMTSSTQSAFAKMTAAANLYGIAYQAMSNDNLSAAQKFSMMAIQAAGQSAITALTVDFSKTTADAAMNSASVLGKLWSQLGWGAVPVYAIFTGLLGGLMGLAASKIAKSKSEIAQATGASVGAGRLATGMLTYAEGNVNELTDPASLTPGRQYNVDGADGKTYRARYMGKGAKTHITNGPEFHLVGEAGREAIIDAKTTRLLQLNETGIWRDIQTLYNGGSISGMASRRRRGGVRAFADGNIGEFEEMADGGGLTAEGTGGGMSIEMLASLQASIDRQSDLLENALTKGIKAVNKWTGSDGIPAMYNKMQKEAQRHGEKYL